MTRSYLAIIWISCGKELTQKHIYMFQGSRKLAGLFFVHIIWVINLQWLVVPLINGIKVFNTIANVMGSQRVTP
jgi:hypothetical protein